MRRVFRKKSLRHLADSDALELMIPLRYSPFFLPFIVACAIIVVFALAWGFLARLPVSVEAEGAIVARGGVREVAVASSGLVKERFVDESDRISAGDVILRVENLQRRADYEAKREAYLAFAEAKAYALRMHGQRMVRRTRDLENQIALHRATLENLRRIEEKFVHAITSYVEEKRSVAKGESAEASALLADQGEMLEGARRLREKGYAPLTRLVERQAEWNRIHRSLNDISVKKRFVNVEEQRLRLELNDVETRIGEEENAITRLEGEIAEASESFQSKKYEIQQDLLEKRDELVIAEQNLWLSENVLSPYDGELLAVNKSPGAAVTEASAVALIGLSEQRGRLLLVHSEAMHKGAFVLAYRGRSERVVIPPTDDGLRPVFARRLRDALGDLLGVDEVIVKGSGNRYVIDVPAAPEGALRRVEITSYEAKSKAGVPVFVALVPAMGSWRRQELVNIAFVAPEEAKKITGGADAVVRPDFIKGLQAGRVLGRVRQVSEFASTKIELEGLIGNLELGTLVAAREKGVAVVVEILRDNTGQPIWRGAAPERQLKLGTTTTTRILVKEVPPIRLLFPIFVEPFL